LGGTRSDIAREKIGILKPQSVLVTSLSSHDEAGAVLAARAAALNCTVLRPRIAAGADIETGNVATAGAVLDQVGLRYGLRARTHPQEQVGAWLLDPPTCDRARLPGRLEQRQADGVRVVFDGAHVPFNLSAVLRDLHGKQEFLGPCAALVSLAGDKDAEGFLGILAAQNVHAVFVDLPGSGRARRASDLEDIARRLGLSHDHVPGLVNAWRHGLEFARERRGWLFVTGSLSLVGALRGFSQPISFKSVSRAAEHT
jgi:dihydrofolate synthase/folylpolyglutamate synthase